LLYGELLNMFTFNYDEVTMLVNKPDADSALEFADKMLVSTADGYWSCHVDNEQEYTWKRIVRVPIGVENVRM